ncbi:MAG: septum formation protein Maf [Phycisphaerae bacterium]|nr:septum formation protein Maf [Phycisphaerae bacterium]
MAHTRLILASGSPRRRELLAEAGYRFEVVRPELEEPELDEDLGPEGTAEALAYFKARAAADAADPSQVILGADTVVALGRQIFGKPRDADHARTMLRLLSHNRHRVITGVALLKVDDRLFRRIDREITHITMKPMSEDQIEEHLRTTDWRDKAGAYAVQEQADRYVMRYEGSFTNIVGLPMELVNRILAAEGIVPER